MKALSSLFYFVLRLPLSTVKQFCLINLLFLPGFCLAQKTDTLISGSSIIAEKDSTFKKGYVLFKKEGDDRNTLRLSKVSYYYLTKDTNAVFKDHSAIDLIVEQKKNMGFQLSVDQDAFYKPKNEDRDYTMGLMATVIGHLRKDRIIWWTKPLTEAEKEASRVHFNFGFSGFTPLDIGNPNIDRSDRPYSALAYLSYAQLFNYGADSLGAFKRTRSFKHSLLIGTMGKGISRTAQFIQTAIHSGQRALAEDPNDVRPDPLGWKYAIAYHASFPVVINYEASFSVYNLEYTLIPEPAPFLLPLKLSVKPNVGFAIGTLYDNLSAGVDYQFGLFDVDSQFGNSTFKDARGYTIHKKKLLWGFSVIGDVYANGWLHNATLNGILFNNSKDEFVIKHRDMERLTWYSSVGGQFTIGNFKFGYSVYNRSKVIKFSPRNQYFGRFFLKVDI